MQRETYKSLVAALVAETDEIMPWDLADEIATEATSLLLDIRCPDEYDAAHIPDSLNVPRGILEIAVDYGYKETAPKRVEARGASSHSPPLQPLTACTVIQRTGYFNEGIAMHTPMARFAATLFGLWLGIASLVLAADPVVENKTAATAIFAGGCFWCMEPPFDALAGVTATTSGFTGGQKVNPSYKEVSSGGTGHVEALQISYDPAQVSYQQLLDVYWRNIDPVDDGGQFCDRGHEYLSAIFYQNEEQKKLAEQSKAAVEKRLGHSVATAIRPAAPFYAAEDYHQDYYRKNPVRYKYYRYSCGRDQRLEEFWGKQEK